MSTAKLMVWHAWYSKTQKIKNNEKRIPCKVIYLKEDGTKIEVTEVSKTMNGHEKRYTDSQYLGTVIKWLQNIKS